jgi:hypothetical protein
MLNAKILENWKTNTTHLLLAQLAVYLPDARVSIFFAGVCGEIYFLKDK